MAAKTREEKRWQAQNDLSTIQQAEQIKKDRARMAAAKRLAREQAASLRKIAGRKPTRRK